MSNLNNVSTPIIQTADDDISAHIPASLKQQICKGAYTTLPKI